MGKPFAKPASPLSALVLQKVKWRAKAQEEFVEKYAAMTAITHDSGYLWQ